jgi:hypothetical protein
MSEMLELASVNFENSQKMTETYKIQIFWSVSPKIANDISIDS